MIAWIRRRPVVAYYALALLLSWSYWIALILAGQRVEPGSAATHLPGLAMPFVAALAVTAVASGGAGVRAFLASTFLPRRPYLRGLALAVSPLALAALSFLVLAATGTPVPGLADFSPYPGLPPGWPLWLLFLAALLLNGIGEEAGWRGFATDRLSRSHGRFRGTLIVALQWLVWHLPLFWLHAGMQDLIGLPLLGWVAGLAGAAFLLGWVYLASGRSILVVAIWHTLYNFTVATPAGSGTPQAVISTLVLVGGIAVAIAWWRQENTAGAPA